MVLYLKTIFAMMLINNSKMWNQETSCGRSANFQLFAENSRADIAAILLGSEFVQFFSLCTHICLANELCKSFNYNSGTKVCQVLSYNLSGSGARRLVPSPGWSFYQKVQPKVCHTLI